MDEMVLCYHMRALTRVVFMTVLPLSFVQIRRIPPFSLFGVINGWFSSCSSKMYTLVAQRHYRTNTVAVEDGESKSMSQCELTSHTRPSRLYYWLSCAL